MICFSKLANGTIEELDDEECVQEKPNDEEDCSVETPCGASDWMATEWSGCEDSCGKFRKLCLYSFNAFFDGFRDSNNISSLKYPLEEFRGISLH